MATTNKKNKSTQNENNIAITDDKMINEVLGNIGKKSKDPLKKSLVNNFLNEKKNDVQKTIKKTFQQIIMKIIMEMMKKKHLLVI